MMCSLLCTLFVKVSISVLDLVYISGCACPFVFVSRCIWLNGSGKGWAAQPK